MSTSSSSGFAGLGGRSVGGGGGNGSIPVSPTGVGYAWQGDSRDSLQPIRKGQQYGLRGDEFARHGFGEGGPEGQVRHHEDSGLRIGNAARAAPLMDVPPVYTAV